MHGRGQGVGGVYRREEGTRASQLQNVELCSDCGTAARTSSSGVDCDGPISHTI